MKTSLYATTEWISDYFGTENRQVWKNKPTFWCTWLIVETKWAEWLNYAHTKHPAAFHLYTFRVFTHHKLLTDWLKKVLYSKIYNTVSIFAANEKITEERNALMILRTTEGKKVYLSKIQTCSKQQWVSPPSRESLTH